MLEEGLEVLRRKIGPYHQHERSGSQARDRCEVRHRVIVEFLEQAHVRRLRRIGRHHERVAVGRGAGDFRRGDPALRTGLVLDDERLAQSLLELRADQPCDLIGGAAGRERHHELYRLGWVALPLNRKRAQREDDGKKPVHRTLPQAFRRASSSLVFAGSLARSTRWASACTSARLVRRIRSLISRSCEGCIEKLRSPRPRSSRVSCRSPAISPHTATGTPPRVAVWMVPATSVSTAGCSGSYRCATASSVRSMARVYWMRSLVPIDRKLRRRMKIGRASAAAGISIMPPISISRW